MKHQHHVLPIFLKSIGRFIFLQQKGLDLRRLRLICTMANDQSSIPTLHHLSSSQSFRVLFALEELAEANGLKYNLKNYQRDHAMAPKELKSISPLGKSPILTVEPLADQTNIPAGQESKRTITESRIMLQFVSDNYSKGIWEPETASDKDRDVFYQEFANSTLAQKVSFPLLFEAIPPQLPLGLRQVVQVMIKPVVSHFKGDLLDIYQVMEDALSDQKPWFSGAKLGLADFCMSWGMDMATQRKYFEAAKYPKTKAWYEKVQARPAYQRAREKGGSYDLVTFK